MCATLLETMRRLNDGPGDYQFIVYWSSIGGASPCQALFEQVLAEISDPLAPTYNPSSPYIGLNLVLRGVDPDLTAVGSPACLERSCDLLNDPNCEQLFGQREVVQTPTDGLLGFPCGEGVSEDWGSAIAYVAQLHPWREDLCGGRRFMIPISDEAPRCGGKGAQNTICDDAPATIDPPFIGGPDYRITRQASACAIFSRLWVMPIVGCSQCNPCIECPGCPFPCRSGGGGSGSAACPDNWQEICQEPLATSCTVPSCVLEQARLFSYYTTGIETYGFDAFAPPGIGDKPFLVHPTLTRFRSDIFAWITPIVDFLTYRIGNELCVVPCESTDFNRDGLYPADQDLIDFLAVLAGGTCSNAPVCGLIDFNANCLFPEDEDLIEFLRRLAGGECGGGG
jgi:hypothetical protein